MLNYIWLGLIVIGIGVALHGDIRDISSDAYRNGTEYNVSLTILNSSDLPLKNNQHYQCSITLNLDANRSVFGQGHGVLIQRAQLIAGSAGYGVMHMIIDDSTPPLWKEISKIQKNNDYLLGHVSWEAQAEPTISAKLRFDPVTFVRMNAVTNDGIMKYAKTAVELAIGLIGIMALWLGLMKIAEESGLVVSLGKALRPITTRLFPDVPPDHPAMGAMIMNISANMLGLMNAATPLGLKAMEELNKLNRKLGTATDAMCTFLVINTSSVQLIPATVIAIRVAAGSANPTEILGPVILATTVNTVIGVITVKLLGKLPVFKRQLE